MDARCRIEMFGGLQVRQGDVLHTRFRSHKAAALLAYLALYLQQTHARDRLLDLFWPEMPPEAGRDNLSTTLSQLRRQLEPVGVVPHSILTADRQQIRLNEASVTSDAAEFDALILKSAHSETPAQKTEILEKAVALYRGDLLPENYEDWALREQTRCQSLLLQTLDQLERLYEQEGRYEAAMIAAQRAAQIDPYLEEAYRAQMRLQVRMKRPAAALQIYEAVQQRFQKELGVQPSALTRQFAERVRQDPNAALLLREQATSAPTAVSRPAPVAAPDPSQTASVAPSETSQATSAAPASPLPLPLTRFYGRRRELEALQSLLETPGVRLVTLLGPGGAGKTRLSIEVAARMQGALGDRVWFISLADLPDAGLILSALAHALHLRLSAQGDPLDQAAAALGEAPGLLVLDNFEHLLGLREGKNETLERGGAALIRLLLQRAPNVKCLVTSRKALRLSGEQEFVLPPLALPKEEANAVSLEALLENDSVGLYVDRARLARADFALTAGNASAIIQLCRRLEGIPLAIEMAAAWAKTVPPTKMLERLEHQLDLLVSRRRDLPARHQSLRATIEWSYALLEPEVTRLFTGLSVFRGGWTLEAAEAVVGLGALMGLAELQEHSLIVRADAADEEAEPRYRMLEPLREFAAEKLNTEGWAAAVERAHADYFLAMVDKARQEMEHAGIKDWMDRLEMERENIRAALTWLEVNAPEEALRLAGRFWRFWELRGYVQEGRARLKALLTRCGDEPPTTDRAQAHHAAGALAANAGDYPSALRHYEQVLKIGQALGDRYYIAMSKQQSALAAEETGDDATAARLLEEAIALYQELGRRDLVANNQCNLAVIALTQGDFGRAQELLNRALAIQREVGDLRSIAITLNNLGSVALSLHDREQARSCQAESLRITCDLGNRRGSAYALEAFADIATHEGCWERAVTLWGAAQALREKHGCPLTPAERGDWEPRLEEARSHLNQEQFTAAWNAGQTACLQEAVHAALNPDNIL